MKGKKQENESQHDKTWGKKRNNELCKICSVVSVREAHDFVVVVVDDVDVFLVVVFLSVVVVRS